MPKPKLTATLPDGTKATRRTDNAYTHIVAVQHDHADDWADAKRSLDVRVSHLARVQAAIDAGEGTRQDELDLEWLTGPRGIARMEAELAKIPTEGTYWSALSWHGRLDLAAKAVDKFRSYSSKPVQICEVDPS